MYRTHVPSPKKRQARAGGMAAVSVGQLTARTLSKAAEWAVVLGYWGAPVALLLLVRSRRGLDVADVLRAAVRLPFME